MAKVKFEDCWVVVSGESGRAFYPGYSLKGSYSDPVLVHLKEDDARADAAALLKDWGAKYIPKPLASLELCDYVNPEGRPFKAMGIPNWTPIQ